MSLVRQNGLGIVLVLLLAGVAQGQKSTVKTNSVTQKKASAGAGKTEGSTGPVLRRSNRMEFDGRLIKGERAAGAVYLFNRVPRKLPPLLKLERDELDRIVWPVLKRPADKPKVANAAPAKSVKKASKSNLKQDSKKAKRTQQRSWKRNKKKSWKGKRR